MEADPKSSDLPPLPQRSPRSLRASVFQKLPIVDSTAVTSESAASGTFKQPAKAKRGGMRSRCRSLQGGFFKATRIH